MMPKFRVASTTILIGLVLLFGMVMVTVASSGIGTVLGAPALTYMPFVGNEYWASGTKISFDRYLDGAPITQDTVLHGDEFSAAGILLAGAPTGSYCADATAAAILVPPHAFGGLDFTFLSSSRPGSATGCNGVAVEVTFLQGVSEVTIVFGGATTEYVLSAYDSVGNLLGTATKMGESGAGTSAITFSSGTTNIKRITFGHEQAITAITELHYKR